MFLTSPIAQKRNVEPHLIRLVGLIRNLILSWVSAWTEIQLPSATSKFQPLLTLNFRGESHDKGLPENADAKASEGFYTF